MRRRFLKRVVQWYLGALTRLVLWRHRPEVIAVSGTTNKSTTKQALAEQLRRGGEEVRENPRSYNTEIGLPLAVLGVAPQTYDVAGWVRALARGTLVALLGRRFPKVLVLELGVSRRGDMATLLKLVRPRVAVLTNVRPSAINPEATLDELTAELHALVTALPPDGLLLFNADDPHLAAAATRFSGLKTGYGVGEGADVRATDVRQDAAGLHWTSGQAAQHRPVFGEHHLYAALAAEALTRRYRNA